MDGEIFNDNDGFGGSDGPEGNGGKEQQHDDNIRKKFWRTLIRAAGQISFIEELIAAYYCTFDPQTPQKIRFQLSAALAYFVLPIDVVPDFIAGIGFGDDAALLMWVLSSVKSHISERHRQLAKDKLKTMQEMP